jgi:WS/DGAT/MGAT family acyltransferase
LDLTTHAPRLVTPTALNRPTGPRRAISVAGVPLGGVVDTAHAHGATVNDVVLAAVGGALGAALGRRGEAPEELVASVPVSARRGTTATRLGNDTGVRPLAIPTQGDPFRRLELVAQSSRLAAARAEGGRAASAAPLLAVFRGLARVGLLRWFINHQRLVHTFVTNVRGPADPLQLMGHRVAEIVPVAISPGNVGVTFDVLSYAGQLVVTVVADPVIVPDHQQVADDLTADLARLTEKRA